ncbi:MAG: hypothetical protein OZSIB_3152 [Candidatus Ozemobacter sibiricus]|uniref:Uncharacterized protein n=1 Tax=Candidatus Ozemobacter sibiricus TaxID=2268124 RepID=A0A367ZQT0_9BACT|nr:MAG: hypothetical protein OZSIB_3152 [Candidatus Ozemobacter sibiricus]
MYKTISLVLILAVVGGLAIMSTGCGGDGGGILGAALGIIAIAAIASSGGAGAAAFAASVRHSPRAAVVATTGYKAVIKVNGVTATETTDLTKKDDNKELYINAEISVNPGTNEYSIELYPATANTTTDPLFKTYRVATVDNGGRTTDNPQLNATATARALAYEEWKKKYPTQTANATINDFSPNQADIDALALKIQNHLDTNMTATVLPDATFKWPATVTDDAKKVASDTPAPTPTTTGNIATGEAYIQPGFQWLPGQTEPQQVSQMQTVPEKIGIAFFPLPAPDNRLTLGNFFGPFTPFANQTTVIRYLPNVTSLDAVTQAGDTYNHHAFGGDSQATQLAENQVYDFLVDGYYGALQIHAVSAEMVTIRYKYNTTKGNKNLNPQAFAAKIAY